MHPLRPVKARAFALENLERRLLLSGDFVWGNAAGGDFNAAANWVGGVAPTAGSNIVIGALNNNAEVDFNGTATLGSVTVSANGALVVQSGTLSVTGSTTVASGGYLGLTGGTYSLSGAGNIAGFVQAVRLNGGPVGTLKIETGATLALSGSGEIEASIGGALVANGALTLNDQTTISVISAATVTVANSALTLNDQSTLSVGNLATLTVAGTASLALNGTSTLTNQNGTLQLSGGTTTASGTTFDQLSGRLLIGSSLNPTGPPLEFRWHV